MQHCLQEFKLLQVAVDYKKFRGCLDSTVKLFQQTGNITSKRLCKQNVLQKLLMQLRKLWGRNHKNIPLSYISISEFFGGNVAPQEKKIFIFISLRCDFRSETFRW
jgi:hypothetical protein